MKYDINRKAVKTSAWSLGKIDKFEYLTGKEILPSYQRKVIEQTKFAYSPLGTVFEKKKENDWRPRRKTNRINWR